MSGVIYRAISPSGKVYIGKTFNFDERKRSHLKEAYNTKEQKYYTHFHNAIRFYGFDTFIWEILFNNIPSEEELSKLEIDTIKQYNATDTSIGYNMTEGGEGGTLTQSAREKISLAQQGKNNSMFGRRGERSPRYGKRHSAETRQKMSIAVKNFFQDPKEREKVAILMGGKPFDVFRRDTGEYIGTWINQHECAVALGSLQQNIYHCLKRHRKSSRGYIFRYQ